MKFLIAIMLLLIIPCVSAGYVTSFDSNGIDNKLIAGSVYETESQFTCGETELTIDMTVYHPEILEDEWFVRMYLDEEIVTCTETDAGVFNSTFDVSAGSHTFIIEFQTLPNIMPGEYVVTIYYPDTMVTEEDEPNHRRAHELWREKWSDGGSSTTHLNDTVEGTPVPTEEPTEEIVGFNIELPFEKVCWILAIIAFLVGSACLAWIWFGRNK